MTLYTACPEKKTVPPKIIIKRKQIKTQTSSDVFQKQHYVHDYMCKNHFTKFTGQNQCQA